MNVGHLLQQELARHNILGIVAIFPDLVVLLVGSLDLRRQPFQRLLIFFGFELPDQPVGSLLFVIPHDIGQRVKKVVDAAGGWGAEFNTIAIDDGIAMGHTGMLYSLPSRDLIADSVEYMVNAHCADAMVCTEGGLSNLRFALGKPAVVLTCATRIGLQVWAPPELCTEIRNEQLCEPCMWRLDHVAGKADAPPGKTTHCPQGRTLRDVTAETVWPTVRRHLQEARRDGR